MSRTVIASLRRDPRHHRARVRQVGSGRFERSDEFAWNSDLVSFRALVRLDGSLIDTSGACKHFVGGPS